MKVNSGSVTSNLGLTTCATFFSDGKVNIGKQGVESIVNTIDADLHVESQDNTKCKIAMFSNESASGYLLKSEMEFYGVESYSNNTDPIVRIVASNDKPDIQDAQMANGRLDFEINNESSNSFERHLGPQSRLCITSQGQVGIHNQRPVNIFQASPKYVDGAGTIVGNDTDISGINNIVKL